ncbi:1671_t:CDS:2 [Ambispora gerdemannii]|uniref:1671_t:CDS:1 n=1 Tax=Ambispora gerdemannii TaxID=144530 RepID=A0A9N8VP85_9GLOM|nr:1671_t:CDS:2 [Ambispora gerdemannii]
MPRAYNQPVYLSVTTERICPSYLWTKSEIRFQIKRFPEKYEINEDYFKFKLAQYYST